MLDMWLPTLQDKGCLCGSHNSLAFEDFRYSWPDKYEQWVSINKVDRRWLKCCECGLYRSIRNYPIEWLYEIYQDGYRDPVFRGEKIEDAFNRITSDQYSENEERCRWVVERVRGKSKLQIMDIGSGIGVFPYRLKNRLSVAGISSMVECIEPNWDSCNFIKNILQLPCRNLSYPSKCMRKFDFISAVHVLEHMELPYSFLESIRMDLKDDGILFLEVPDSKEFKYLMPEHDEFNSCHLWFFDLSTLCDCVKSSGFEITDIHCVKTTPRNLSRIMLMARRT